MYSLGVVLLGLLTWEETVPCDPTLPALVLTRGHWGPEAGAVLRGCLAPRPGDRWTLAQLAACDWVRGASPPAAEGNAGMLGGFRMHNLEKEMKKTMVRPALPLPRTKPRRCKYNGMNLAPGA